MKEQEAFSIIEKMINTAKEEIRDNGFYWRLWGYLVFFSALIDFALLHLGVNQHSLIWAISMPSGGIISAIRGRKDAKSTTKISYVDEMFMYLITAFVVSLVIVCFIMPMTQQNWKSFFPTLMVLYAFTLYVAGGMIRFKPLRYGAFIIWGLAGIGFFQGYDVQLILLALGVLSGFIIPGHLLQKKFKENV